MSARREKSWHQEQADGLNTHHAPLPYILLANVVSLDEPRDIRDCNLLCFTETCVNPALTDQLQLVEFFLIYQTKQWSQGSQGKVECF